MSDGKKIFPGFAPVALAVVAGLLAGAVAVYVSGGMSGNMEPVTAAPSAPAAPAVAANTCTAKEARARSVAAAATGEVAAMMATDPPQPAPTLAFDGPDGARTDFGSMSGKVLLVNLWATWCAPCRAEMPALDELQRKLGSADFEVVAMNVDTGDDEKPRKFLEETEIRNLPWYRENSLGLFNDLKRRSLALGLPVTLLVDRDGCIIANMNGPAEWASDDAERLIKAALVP